MTRSRLDQELHELDTDILHLSSLVETALEQALRSLEKGDLALCSQIIEGDRLIDGQRAAIEERAFRLLTLQQPLGSSDLRFLTAALSIAGELERAGDGAGGIALLLIRMAPLRGTGMQQGKTNHGRNTTTSAIEKVPARSAHYMTEASVLQGLLGLGQEARRLLQGTMLAFHRRDVQAARFTWQEDDVVDVRYHQVRHDLLSLLAGEHALPALQQDAWSMQRVTYLLWIAHKLERFADHCTNICKRTVFLVEGDTKMLSSQER